METSEVKLSNIAHWEQLMDVDNCPHCNEAHPNLLILLADIHWFPDRIVSTLGTDCPTTGKSFIETRTFLELKP